jgi:Transposase DDE domain
VSGRTPGSGARLHQLVLDELSEAQLLDLVPGFYRRGVGATYPHQRGIKVRIVRRGIEDKSKLGRVRWVVERTISWLLRFTRLGLRYNRTERTALPLLTLACTVINTHRLIKNESGDQV